MKYYEMHEIVYQRINNDGHLSWDKAPTFDEMWAHDTNSGLTKHLGNLGLTLKDLTVLDLGTGTGTSALFCAKEGAKCTGVEVSKTAIEMAQKHAKTLNLNVEFRNEDILALDLKRKFDLVIDSTVLHCIVGEEDRKRFYATAKKHLAPGGYLFINTMISEGDMTNRFPNEFFHYEDEILWSLGIGEITERKMISGKSYFPHRTLLTSENQKAEFTANGFEVVSMGIKESDVSCMSGLLKTYQEE